MTASDINGGSTEQRTIGNGVVVAYVATVAVIGALLAVGALVGDPLVDPMVGIGVMVALFAAVFGGDIVLQYTEMQDAETPCVEADG